MWGLSRGSRANTEVVAHRRETDPRFDYSKGKRPGTTHWLGGSLDKNSTLAPLGHANEFPFANGGHGRQVSLMFIRIDVNESCLLRLRYPMHAASLKYLRSCLRMCQSALRGQGCSTFFAKKDTVGMLCVCVALLSTMFANRFHYPVLSFFSAA